MKTIKIPFVLILCTFILGLTSCVDDIFVDGNGILRTESRGASNFRGVSSSGDFEVIIVPGTSYSVEVTAESNLLPYIETNVVGDKLRIYTRSMYSLHQNDPIEIYITTPVLQGVALSGSGYIKTGSFMSERFSATLSGSGEIETTISTDRLKANVSGSGNIFLEGEAFESEFVISGSGKIKSYDLDQEHLEASISGSGDMYVNVSRTIDAHISGSGKVYFVNYPVIHTSVSGSGGVVDRN